MNRRKFLLSTTAAVIAQVVPLAGDLPYPTTSISLPTVAEGDVLILLLNPDQIHEKITGGVDGWRLIS